VHSVEDSRDGKTTLQTWLERQERHIPHHIEQMKENHALWLKSHPPRKPATPSARRQEANAARMVTLSAGIC
jgi:hypothetical protein